MCKPVGAAFFALTVPEPAPAGTDAELAAPICGKRISSSSSVAVSSPRRFRGASPWWRRVKEGRKIFWAVLARNQLGGASSASASKLPLEGNSCFEGDVLSFGDTSTSSWRRLVLVSTRTVSADLLAARLSRDSKRVPSNAVFRNEPLRRRVRR